jgi:hypothetical protein
MNSLAYTYLVVYILSLFETLNFLNVLHCPHIALLLLESSHIHSLALITYYLPYYIYNIFRRLINHHQGLLCI